MNSAIKKLLTITTIAVLLSSCKKDEQKDESGPTWTATVNGRLYESTNSKGTLTFVNSTHQRLFTAGGSDENQFISIFFIDTVMNQYVDNNPLLNRIGPAVLYGTSTHGSFQYAEVSSFISFTKFDSTAKLVDGIFNLVTVNTTTNATVTITDGNFKNVPYTVKHEN